MNVRAGANGGIHPLAGIVKCGECKKAMSRKSSKGHAYYCCRTRREKGKQFCKSHSVREKVLYAAVLEAVNLQLWQLGDMRALTQRVQNAPGKPADTRDFGYRITISEKQLENETAVFDKSYYDFARGVISEAQFKRIRGICERRQAELENLIETLRQETKITGVKPAAFDAFQKGRRFTELTRGLAFDLIETVYVYEDMSLEICFRFADPSIPS